MKDGVLLLFLTLQPCLVVSELQLVVDVLTESGTLPFRYSRRQKRRRLRMALVVGNDANGNIQSPRQSKTANGWPEITWD